MPADGTIPAPPEARPFYTPHALLHALGNSIQSPLFNEVFRVKGLFKAGKGVNYNGLFYDILRDEFSDSTLTLVTPERLRIRLSDGQLIEATAFLTKRPQVSTGRIELVLTINEILSRNAPPINEQETRALALLRQKASAGYKDADAYIRKKLFEGQPIRVTILVGVGAIIDHDIKHQVKEAAVAYQFRYIRTNLSQVNEITRTIRENTDTDMLVIARGGGENMQIFDNPSLCESVLDLGTVFITALGHCTDEPLLQKLADKAFITPTALGGYFHDQYNKAMDELNDSKAKLIGDLTRQIDLNYQTRLQDLQARLLETVRTARETRKWAAALVALLLLAIVLILIRIG